MPDSWLMHAVKCGDLSEVQEQLAKGVNVNYADKNGETALHFACKKGDKDVGPSIGIVAALIGNGAKIDAKATDGTGSTPLMHAAYGGRVDIVALLLREGADASYKGRSGKTARDFAMMRFCDERQGQAMDTDARAWREIGESIVRELDAATSAMSSLSVDPAIDMEGAGRFTAEEFANTCVALKKQIMQIEELACHFTTLESAKFILAKGSHGLRASKGGQAGGGLSICVKMPHELGWDRRRGGNFLKNVGKELWGEKAAQAPAGTQVCLMLRIRENIMKGSKTVPGRPAIRIIEADDLGDAMPDGHSYLSQSRIIKAYNLMQD